MLTSRRTEMQPAGGVGNGYNQLRPRLVPEAGLGGGGLSGFSSFPSPALES